MLAHHSRLLAAHSAFAAARDAVRNLGPTDNAEAARYRLLAAHSEYKAELAHAAHRPLTLCAAAVAR